jgi:(p)ppGpp synthase/HD superfamily hydrolase
MGAAIQTSFSDRVVEAWDFAARVHNRQTVPGTDLPYLRHLGLVTLEIVGAHCLEPIADIDLALCCAILHDSVEDQAIKIVELEQRFGAAIAADVAALSKNPSLPKAERMADSLYRISRQPRAVWCVKLADRIANLRGVPGHWSPAHIAIYREEARTILAALGSAHHGLGERLALKISAYPG